MRARLTVVESDDDFEPMVIKTKRSAPASVSVSLAVSMRCAAPAATAAVNTCAVAAVAAVAAEPYAAACVCSLERRSATAAATAHLHRTHANNADHHAVASVPPPLKKPRRVYQRRSSAPAPPPVPQVWSVSKNLRDLIDQFDALHPMINVKRTDRTPGSLCYPRVVEDERFTTWHKQFKHIEGALCNQPLGIDWCWMVPANFPSGADCFVHQLKMCKNGSQGKWLTHRFLHPVVHPQDYPQLADKSLFNNKLHVAHRCGHGLTHHMFGPVCVNPHHTIHVTNAVNQDHKGCKNGCAYLCPHEPKCIFTHADTGAPKPCLNSLQWPDLPNCPHVPPCGPTRPHGRAN